MTTQRSDAQSPQVRPQPEALRAWLHLANVELPPRILNAALRQYRDDPEALLCASDSALEEGGLHARQLARLREMAYTPTPRQVEWMQRPDVSVLWLTHPAYPHALRDIADPPAILFVRGNLLEADRFSVGIVGSRRASPYGRTVAHRFARELAGNGLTVVSGGAVGIDTAAHRGALDAGGRTVAVLGCGLDIDYPRDNRNLFEQVAEHGALVSEYPPGSQPETWHFPARNRLISGMSQGVLVAEAPRASGALITARFAAEQGRPVLAVPGNIDRQGSAGANDLIKDGAVMVTETRDILMALGMIVLPARPEHQAAFNLEWDTEGDSETGTSTCPARSVSQDRSRLLASLPAAQARLMEALSLTPRHIDAIAQEAGMAATQAGVEMTLLELSGHARRLPGNTYIRAL